MKNYLKFLPGILLILFFSCENSSENAVSEIETNLEIHIPVTAGISDNSKIAQNTASIDYSFSGENIYTLSSLTSDNPEVHEVKNIKSTKEAYLSLAGMIGGGQFSSLNLTWGYRTSENGVFILQESIDLLSLKNEVKEGIFTVNLVESLNPLIDKINTSMDNSIKIIVSGKSNFNISEIAVLKIPVIIESNTYTTRFELY
jgi:hypothetical protein